MINREEGNNIFHLLRNFSRDFKIKIIANIVSVHSIKKRFMIGLYQGIKSLPYIFKSDVIICYALNSFIFLLIKMLFYSTVRFKLIVMDIAVSRKISFKNKFQLVLLRLLFSRADSILCPNKQKIMFWRKFVRVKAFIYFFPHWIDEHLLNIINNINNMGETQYPGHDYIISVGRAGRDIDTLIEAVKDLDIYTVLVIGKDPLPDKNIKYLQEKFVNIPKNVQILFDYPKMKTLKLIKNSRLFVLSLKPEPFVSVGMIALLEAMAMGKPIIATKTGYITDYLRDYETGIFCKPKDVRDLKEKISFLLNNLGLAKSLGERATKQVITRFTEYQMVKRLENIIKEVYRKN